MGDRKPRIKLTCPVCEKTFTMNEGEVKYRLKKSPVLICCSKKCDNVRRGLRMRQVV